MRDVVGAIQHVLNHEIAPGPVNTVAPNPVTNAEFTRVLASVLKRPALFPMPALRSGSFSERWAKNSFSAASAWNRPSMRATGYQFQHPELKKCAERDSAAISLGHGPLRPVAESLSVRLRFEDFLDLAAEILKPVEEKTSKVDGQDVRARKPLFAIF